MTFWALRMSLSNGHERESSQQSANKLVLSITCSHAGPECFPHSSVGSALVWVLQAGKGRWKLWRPVLLEDIFPDPCFVLVLTKDVNSRCLFFNRDVLG